MRVCPPGNTIAGFPLQREEANDPGKLAVNGGTGVNGAVASRFMNEDRLDATAHAGAPLNRSLAIVDFKRLPKPLAARLATEPPFGSQRSIGSVALDWCWLAAGRVQVYVHGKQSLWDYAAGQLIAFEAGACTAMLDGTLDQPGAPLALAPRSALAAVSAPLLHDWIEATRYP